jgi:hypothetical protein
MTSEIYKDSESAVVWLGSATAEFHEAADVISQKPKLQDLRVIPCDEYWKRLWIVQEILFAKQGRVICCSMTGIVSLSWNRMRDIATGAAKWMHEHGPPKRIVSLLALRGTSHDKLLFWCIDRFSGYEYHDSQDRVYGSLGVVEEQDRLIFEYNRTTQEVFLEVVRAFWVPLLQCHTVEWCGPRWSKSDVYGDVIRVVIRGGLAN